MNIDRLTILAETLENHSLPDIGFNMSTWYERLWGRSSRDRSGHNCGTVACIGGHAELLFGDYFSKAEPGIRPSSYAADLLQLDSATAHELFYVFPGWDTDDWSPITPAQAAKVIRHLIATGRVDWAILTLPAGAESE